MTLPLWFVLLWIGLGLLGLPGLVRDIARHVRQTKAPPAVRINPALLADWRSEMIHDAIKLKRIMGERAPRGRQDV